MSLQSTTYMLLLVSTPKTSTSLVRNSLLLDQYLTQCIDITLGVGNKEAVDKLQADKTLNRSFMFSVPRIAVCQLGNFGTCRKILFDIPLRVRALLKYRAG